MFRHLRRVFAHHLGATPAAVLRTRRMEIARQLNIDAEVRRGLASMAVASIGPTTSDELRQQGIAIDIEASHPKMGFLVREAAERVADVLRTKRGGAALG